MGRKSIAEKLLAELPKQDSYDRTLLVLYDFTKTRAPVDFYNNLSEAISRGQDLYPTGDTDFDNYVLPIVNEMVAFKTQLEASYLEFINWRQP